MDRPPEKPSVYCFIGRLKSGGKGVRAIRRVTLATAYVAHVEGWTVLGPDPLDMDALMRWEAARVPFNQPRLE